MGRRPLWPKAIVDGRMCAYHVKCYNGLPGGVNGPAQSALYKPYYERGYAVSQS